MIGSNNIEQKSSINFVGVMLDEHISRIDVWTIENKIVANIGLFYRVSQWSFSMKVLLKLCISCYSFLFELCKYYMVEHICNEIEKSLFETKTQSTHYI